MNAEQFKEFMEMMSGRSSSKETNMYGLKAFLDKKTEEVEGHFVKWFLIVEENPTLYLTNIEEVPIKDDDDKVEKTIKDQILELVNNNELTMGQKQQAQEFLLARRDMFTQRLDEW
ncbi:41869_t:CDS:2, partial [Gigaspora margarita]